MATITLADLTRLPIREQIDLSQKLWLHVEREMDANSRAANGCTCPPSHLFGRLPPDFDYSLPYPGLDQVPLEERIELAMALTDAVGPAIDADPDLLPLTESQKRMIDERIEDSRRHPERLLTEEEFWERLHQRLRY